MDPEIDLVADLNAEDDEGLGWSVLSEARDPSRARSGAMLVAGNDQAKAVVPIVAVDEDGQEQSQREVALPVDRIFSSGPATSSTGFGC